MKIYFDIKHKKIVPHVHDLFISWANLHTCIRTFHSIFLVTVVSHNLSLKYRIVFYFTWFYLILDQQERHHVFLSRMDMWILWPCKTFLLLFSDKNFQRISFYPYSRISFLGKLSKNHNCNRLYSLCFQQTPQTTVMI